MADRHRSVMVKG